MNSYSIFNIHIQFVSIRKRFSVSPARELPTHVLHAHASRACKLVCRQRLLTATSCNQTFRQTNPRTEHPFVFFLAGCSQRAKYLSHTQCICCASISLCYILSKRHYLIEAKTIKNNSLKP